MVGGSGSYTYTWTYVSGTHFGINATGNACYFQFGGGANVYTGVFNCVVFDTVLSRTVSSNNVTATITLTQ